MVTLSESTDRHMPYSKNAKYKHNRQLSPDKFVKSSLRTVPLSHTQYRGKKFAQPGAKAITGILKPPFRKKGKFGVRKKWAIQSILTLK